MGRSDRHCLWVLVLALSTLLGCSGKKQEEFTRQTNLGKNYYDQGQFDKAIVALEKAVQLRPEHPDAHLNLANAYLRANQPQKALQHAEETLHVDHSSGAGHYLAGCALLRMGRPVDAIKELQQAKDIDLTVNPVSFQLGLAYQQATNFAAAREQFQEVTQFDPTHGAAYYALSQVLLRLNRTDEAQEALAQHEKIKAGQPTRITDPALFEKCRYTEMRTPFELEQPDLKGMAVTFADVTEKAFPGTAKQYSGPVAVIDLEHTGWNSLFVMESNVFRLLLNSNGTFQAQENAMPALADAKYHQALVADFNGDHYDDVIILGDKGSHVFKFATNGGMTDASRFSRLAQVGAETGVLVDLDFSAKLDLVILRPPANEVRVLRNLSNPYFVDHTTNSGVPLSLSGVRQVVVEDWNNDELPDLFLVREGQPPLLLVKQRGGALAQTNIDLPAAITLTTGDLNNDLRPDLALFTGSEIICLFNGTNERRSIPVGASRASVLKLIDYDNDGWLDIVLADDGVRVWRNRGKAGFEERTAALGLDKIRGNRIMAIAAADFDRDGDTDLLLAREGAGLQLLSNQGGNKNLQVKIDLVGHKANASGIGIVIEAAAGGLRVARRVTTLPNEIGVGPHQQLDALRARFAVHVNYSDFKVDPTNVFTLDELVLPEGSCPYLYAWDGKTFRFVTDLLGAAPAGLPVAEGRYIESDPDEYVWIGDEKLFAPRDGHYVLQITEELREVLYLDEAKLVAVDHPPTTEVHTTGKLLPGKPFPPHALVTLHHRYPLLHAINDQGKDVTDLLQDTDGRRVSPTKLRMPQLRGLAEPHSVTLDFGELPGDKPLVLALTGWLRFGGATANIAASLEPDLPFPFPVLEVESHGQWTQVPVIAGAPAGKTKSIIIDLAGKLPSGARRLRLRTGFEIHWDRIALFEKRDNSETHITFISPDVADLHWRGFSEFKHLPWHEPLTTDYESTYSTARWTITPSGWCTRYGDVRELIDTRDNALALINGGDELTLKFSSHQLPSKPTGAQRDFFLWSVGWDKDADFHCVRGAEVEPLPWHGMDDQQYGHQIRPPFPSDELMKKYNTRWVGPYTLTRKN
jgi:tetratricopeptide (TPR) repeat protein